MPQKFNSVATCKVNRHPDSTVWSNARKVRFPVTPSATIVDDLPAYRRLQATFAGAERAQLPNPYFSCHEGISSNFTVIDGEKYANFSSFNYLGMAGHTEVKQAAQDAIACEGTSVSASRLVSGERSVHRQLERELADFLGMQDALTFVSGHATNVSTIGHLLGPGDLVLHDVLAHNSIVEGCRLSGACRRAFPHNDWHACERLLRRLRGEYRRVLVAIEGAYSMDGDYPDLPEFLRIKQQHRAFLLVDEAHSLGTLGATGRGLAEHFQAEPAAVDLWMGTLSKALGSCGGYIAASNKVVQYLRYTAPGFVFSVGMTPANTAAALAALRVLRREPQRVVSLRANSQRFLHAARRAGLDTGTSNGTPIVPIILGDTRRVLSVTGRMLQRHINVRPILPPAVSEHGARLRFFITSEHTFEQIDAAIAALSEELGSDRALPVAAMAMT